MLPQIDYTTFIPQVFWLGVTFSTLYFIVSKFITPKLERIFTIRKSNIDLDINTASGLSAEISALKLQYEEELLKINLQAKNLLQSQTNLLNKEYDIKKTKLLKDLDILKTKSLNEIEEAINSVKNSKNDTSIRLAALIIEKIINRKADLKILTNCYREQ